MLFPQSSAVLTKQSVEVSSRGELVILRIGNVDLPMHYVQALDISRWIRDEGRVIKRGTGRAKTLRSLGVIHDAEAKATSLPAIGGVAIHVRPKLQSWRREDVTTTGRLVNIKIGRTTVNFHFENALKIAQWLRLRAKEAKARAGDTDRHWSTIGNSEG